MFILFIEMYLWCIYDACILILYKRDTKGDAYAKRTYVYTFLWKKISKVRDKNFLTSIYSCVFYLLGSDKLCTCTVYVLKAPEFKITWKLLSWKKKHILYLCTHSLEKDFVFNTDDEDASANQNKENDVQTAASKSEGNYLQSAANQSQQTTDQSLFIFQNIIVFLINLVYVILL